MDTDVLIWLLILGKIRMSFLTSFPKETETQRHHVSLCVYDPVLMQIHWPALTKFNREVQTALSYEVPIHLQRNRSLGRRGGLSTLHKEKWKYNPPR